MVDDEYWDNWDDEPGQKEVKQSSGAPANRDSARDIRTDSGAIGRVGASVDVWDDDDDGLGGDDGAEEGEDQSNDGEWPASDDDDDGFDAAVTGSRTTEFHLGAGITVGGALPSGVHLDGKSGAVDFEDDYWDFGASASDNEDNDRRHALDDSTKELDENEGGGDLNEEDENLLAELGVTLTGYAAAGVEDHWEDDPFLDDPPSSSSSSTHSARRQPRNPTTSRPSASGKPQGQATAAGQHLQPSSRRGQKSPLRVSGVSKTLPHPATAVSSSSPVISAAMAEKRHSPTTAATGAKSSAAAATTTSSKQQRSTMSSTPRHSETETDSVPDWEEDFGDGWDDDSFDDSPSPQQQQQQQQQQQTNKLSTASAELPDKFRLLQGKPEITVLPQPSRLYSELWPGEGTRMFSGEVHEMETWLGSLVARQNPSVYLDLGVGFATANENGRLAPNLRAVVAKLSEQLEQLCVGSTVGSLRWMDGFVAVAAKLGYLISTWPRRNAQKQRASGRPLGRRSQKSRQPALTLWGIACRFFSELASDGKCANCSWSSDDAAAVDMLRSRVHVMLLILGKQSKQSFLRHLNRVVASPDSPADDFSESDDDDDDDGNRKGGDNENTDENTKKNSTASTDPVNKAEQDRNESLLARQVLSVLQSFEPRDSLLPRLLLAEILTHHRQSMHQLPSIVTEVLVSTQGRVSASSNASAADRAYAVESRARALVSMILVHNDMSPITTVHMHGLSEQTEAKSRLPTSLLGSRSSFFLSVSDFRGLMSPQQQQQQQQKQQQIDVEVEPSKETMELSASELLQRIYTQLPIGHLKARAAFALGIAMREVVGGLPTAETLFFESLFLLSETCSGYTKGLPPLVSELGTNVLLQFAEVLLLSRKYVYSIAAFSAAASLLRLRGRVLRVTSLLNRMISFALAKNDTMRVLSFYRDLLVEYTVQQKMKQNEIFYLIERIAGLCTVIGRFQLAESYLQSGLRLFPPAAQDVRSYKLKLSLAQVYLRSYHFDKGVQLLQDLRVITPLSERTAYLRLLAAVYMKRRWCALCEQTLLEYDVLTMPSKGAAAAALTMTASDASSEAADNGNEDYDGNLFLPIPLIRALNAAHAHRYDVALSIINGRIRLCATADLKQSAMLFYRRAKVLHLALQNTATNLCALPLRIHDDPDVFASAPSDLLQECAASFYKSYQFAAAVGNHTRVAKCTGRLAECYLDYLFLPVALQRRSVDQTLCFRYFRASPILGLGAAASSAADGSLIQDSLATIEGAAAPAIELSAGSCNLFFMLTCLLNFAELRLLQSRIDEALLYFQECRLLIRGLFLDGSTVLHAYANPGFLTRLLKILCRCVRFLLAAPGNVIADHLYLLDAYVSLQEQLEHGRSSTTLRIAPGSHQQLANGHVKEERPHDHHSDSHATALNHSTTASSTPLGSVPALQLDQLHSTADGVSLSTPHMAGSAGGNAGNSSPVVQGSSNIIADQSIIDRIADITSCLADCAPGATGRNETGAPMQLSKALKDHADSIIKTNASMVRYNSSIDPETSDPLLSGGLPGSLGSGVGTPIVGGATNSGLGGSGTPLGINPVGSLPLGAGTASDASSLASLAKLASGGANARQNREQWCVQMAEAVWGMLRAISNELLSWVSGKQQKQEAFQRNQQSLFRCLVSIKPLRQQLRRDGALRSSANIDPNTSPIADSAQRQQATTPRRRLLRPHSTLFPAEESAQEGEYLRHAPVVAIENAPAATADQNVLQRVMYVLYLNGSIASYAPLTGQRVVVQSVDYFSAHDASASSPVTPRKTVPRGFGAANATAGTPLSDNHSDSGDTSDSAPSSSSSSKTATLSKAGKHRTATETSAVRIGQLPVKVHLMSRSSEHTLLNVSPRITLLQLMRYICSRDGMKTSEAETPRSVTRRMIQYTIGKGNKTSKLIKVSSTTKDYTTHLNELLHGLFDQGRNQMPPCCQVQRAAFSGDVSSLDTAYFDLAFAFSDARNNITPIDRLEDTQVIHCFQQHFNLDAAPQTARGTEHSPPPLNLYLYVRLEGNTLRSTPLLPSSSVPLGGSSSVLHLTHSDARFLRRLISPDRASSRSLKMTSSGGNVPSAMLTNSSGLEMYPPTPIVPDDSSILALPPGLDMSSSSSSSSSQSVALADTTEGSSSDLLENQTVRKYIAQILDAGLEPLAALRPKRVPSKLDPQAFIARIFGSVVEFPLSSDPSDFDKPIVLIASRPLQFLPWELMFGEPTVRYSSIAGLHNVSTLAATSPPPMFIVFYDSSSTKERQSAQNMRKRALSRALMQRFNLKDGDGSVTATHSTSSEALASSNVVLPYDTGLVRPGHKPKQRKYRHVHFIDLHGLKQHEDIFDDAHPFRVVLMQMADFVDSSELVHYLLSHPAACTLVFVAESHFLFAVSKLNKMMETYAKQAVRTSHRARAPYLQMNERYFFLMAGIQSLQRDHAVPLVVFNAPLFT